MAAFTSELLVRLIDGVSGPAKRAGIAIAALRREAAASTGFQSKLATMQANQMASLAKWQDIRAAQKASLIDNALGIYAVARAMTPLVKAGAAWEQGMEDIRAKLNDNGASMKQYSDMIQRVAVVTHTGAEKTRAAADWLLGIDPALGLNEKAMMAITKTARAARAEVMDVAKAGQAAMSHMGIKAESLQRALDIMYGGGREGGFELKAMGGELPEIFSASSMLRSTGLRGVADVVSSLQVARHGFGTEGETATGAKHFIKAITAPKTVRALKKFGVNLEKEIMTAVNNGESAIGKMVDIADRISKKNPYKVGTMFGDHYAKTYVNELVKRKHEWIEARKKFYAMDGEVEKDLAKRFKLDSEKLEEFAAKWEVFKIRMGGSLLPAVGDGLINIGATFGPIEKFVEKNKELVSTGAKVAAWLLAMRIGWGFTKWLFADAVVGIKHLGVGLFKATRWAAGFVGALKAGKGLGTAIWGANAAAKGAQGAGWLARIGAFGAGAMKFNAAAMSPRGLMGRFGGGLSTALLLAQIMHEIGVHTKWFADKATDGVEDQFRKKHGRELDQPPTAYERQGQPQKWSGWQTLNVPEPWSDLKTQGKTGFWPLFEWGDGDSKIQGLAASIGQAGNAAGDAAGKIAAAAAALASFRVPSIPAAAGAAPAGAGAPGGAPTGTKPAGRAAGGRVRRGGSYIVGENGPEAFNPDQNGRITPNRRGGAITQNVSITTGSGDPHEIAQAVQRAMESQARELMRGMQYDLEPELV